MKQPRHNTRASGIFEFTPEGYQLISGQNKPRTQQRELLTAIYRKLLEKANNNLFSGWEANAVVFEYWTRNGKRQDWSSWVKRWLINGYIKKLG